jgi:hypothetical protein
MGVWELSEYVGEALVVVGVVGEVWAEWRDTKNKLAKIFSVVLIAGLAISLAALKQTNEDFEEQIAESKVKASQANERAAKDEADAASAKAGNIQLGIELESAKAETAQREGELAKEQRNTARAQEDAARSQLALNENLESIANRQLDRRIDGKKLIELLAGKPKKRVAIWYQPNDIEAWDFAEELYGWLSGPNQYSQYGAGWTVSPPIPISTTQQPENGSLLANAPLGADFGGAYTPSGIEFLAKTTANKDISDPHQPFEPALDALWHAILSSMLPEPFSGSEVDSDASLPDDLIVVVILRKPTHWYSEKALPKTPAKQQSKMKPR